jgi:hypothetical protein
LAAIAQPMFNSLPVVLAATWFSMSERDVATAIASLFNPLGNALGQVNVIDFLPPSSKFKNGLIYHILLLISLKFNV